MEPDAEPGVITSSGIAITVALRRGQSRLVAMWFTSVNAPVTAQAGGRPTPRRAPRRLGSLCNAVILVLAVFATTLVADLARSGAGGSGSSPPSVFVGDGPRALPPHPPDRHRRDLGLHVETTPPSSSRSALAAGAVALLAAASAGGEVPVFAPLITGLLSAEVGSYFASAICPSSRRSSSRSVFSVYDIYAVFKGPLRQLVTCRAPEVLPPGHIQARASSRSGRATPYSIRCSRHSRSTSSGSLCRSPRWPRWTSGS